MNTMSAPLIRLFRWSYSSSAAWRPSSGLEPEPRPRVVSLPMCTRVLAADCSSDCMSVFTAMNSTPSTSASIMRLTAFTPAPPTPMTRSTGSMWPRAVGAHCGCGACSMAGGSGSRSMMFSGMSAEKTLRRRSSGVGTPPSRRPERGSVEAS